MYLKSLFKIFFWTSLLLVMSIQLVSMPLLSTQQHQKSWKSSFPDFETYNNYELRNRARKDVCYYYMSPLLRSHVKATNKYSLAFTLIDLVYLTFFFMGTWIQEVFFYLPLDTLNDQSHFSNIAVTCLWIPCVVTVRDGCFQPCFIHHFNSTSLQKREQSECLFYFAPKPINR